MYLTPQERMRISLRREEAAAMGVPLYKSYDEVSDGLCSKTICQKIKRPVASNELPAAYVLNRSWLGYLPLYKRDISEEGILRERNYDKD